MSDVRERAIGVIASVLRVTPASLNDQSSPDDVPSWDSMRHLQVLLAIEEEFAIQFPADAADTLQTAGAIVAAIAERTA